LQGCWYREDQNYAISPPGNGQTERFNRTLLGMLGTLSEDKKTDWPSYVAPMVYAYNCTKHGSTGYSPYYLMFGRQPRLPIDIALGLDQLNKKSKPYSTYVDNLRAKLAHAYDLASKAIHERAEGNKKNYDQYTKESFLEVGNHVLVRNLSTRGKHKCETDGKRCHVWLFEKLENYLFMRLNQ
jgi:hypothetical protein